MDALDLDHDLRPDGLGLRGTALWESYASAGSPSKSRLVMVGEACRLTDALDKLDRICRGDADTWAVLITDDFGGVEIKIDGAVNERRQTVNTLRQLIQALDADAAPVVTGVSFLDKLAANRADRIAEAQTS